MTVIIINYASNMIKGDISKLLFMIEKNVYVGKISKRVRDELWERIKNKSTQKDNLIMLYEYKNEKGFKIKNISNGNKKMYLDEDITFVI